MKTIYGAFLIEKWVSKKYKKTIYLFGEKHNRDVASCPPGIGIEQFLEEEILSSSKPIDIFAEIETLEENEIRRPRTVETYLRPSFLFIDFHNKFLNCLQNDNRRCPYPNLQIHFIDNRMSPLYVNTIYLIDNLNSLKNNLTKRPLSQIKKNALFEINRFLKKEKKNYERREILESKINSDIQNSEVEDALSEIPYPEVVNLIRRFSNSWRENECLNRNLNWSEMVKTLNQIIQIVQDLNTPDSLRLDKINQLIKPIDDCLTEIYTYSMDTYTLANIFRVDEDGYSPSNIIIYTGAAHSLKLSKVFQALDFKCEYQKFDPNHINCLDISDLPTPLFP